MTLKGLRPGHYKILLVTLILMVVLALIIARAPYMHDFAEWVYQAQIIKRMVVDPAAVSAFILASYPVPNSLASIILTGLSFVFAPLWAGKVFLILMLVAWYVVIRQFTKRFVEPQWRDPAALVLYASIALATFFWYGFVSYQLALLLLTWFFSTYREDSKAPFIALFAVAIFFSHAIIFLVFGLFLGVRLLLKWNWSVVIGLTPAALLSLWFLAGRHLANIEPQRIDAVWRGIGEMLIYKAGYPAMLGPFKNFLLPNGSSVFENHAWIYWAGFLTNFIVAAVFGVLILTVLWRYLKKTLPENTETQLLRNTWAISMVLLVLFYLFAPYHFFGVVNAGGRVLVPLLLMALMLGGNAARPFVQAIVGPIIVVALVTAGSYFYLMMQTGQKEFSPIATDAVKAEASDSVLEFNERLYASSRYKYFNYRIFAFARRFDQIEREQFQGLSFRHAMLVKYEPENK